MCGIAGVFGCKSGELSEGMGDAIAHRGPDGGGTLIDETCPISLTMRRLAIIDPIGGNQPMESQDGRYVLVYNGEIFNAAELRISLQNRGVQFLSDHSDTEVLLNILITEGISGIEKLNGMFAFCLYDRQAKTLTCARDRFGIKPLYYFSDGEFFAFASEMKAILGLPFVSRKINNQSLLNYLGLMFVPGADSIIENVHRLLPGHYLTFNIETLELRIQRWWKLSFTPDHTLSVTDWSQRIRDELQSAVKRWSISDVPVGASLSGGLDSSAIVTFAAKSGLDIETYSLGYTDPLHPNSLELDLARQLAQSLGVRHHEVIFNPSDLVQDLPQIVRALDEPYGGGLPTWKIFRSMRGCVKVALTGVGGDELFGNYGKWISSEMRIRKISRLPSLSRYLVNHDFLYNAEQNILNDRQEFRLRYFEGNYYLRDEEREHLLLNSAGKLQSTADYLFDLHGAGRAFKARDSAALLDFETQLPDEFLLMTDRFSMFHSIEARTPFLDNELVNLVLQIPADKRTKLTDPKYLLRQALTGVLPAKIISSPKRGFTAPISDWLRGPLSQVTEELLSPAALESGGIFNPAVYARFVKPHLDGTRDFSTRVWSLLMFELWRSNFQAHT